MPDVACHSVLGHDDVVHALDGNGYCLCGMGRKSLGNGLPDIRDLYSNEPVRCLICLGRMADGYRTGTVWIHHEGLARLEP